MRIVPLAWIALLTMTAYVIAEDDPKPDNPKPSADSARSSANEARDFARDTAKETADEAEDSARKSTREEHEDHDSANNAQERVRSSTSRDRDDRSRESRSRDRDDSSYSRRDRDDQDSGYDRQRSDREERSLSRDDREDRSEGRSRERSRLGATFSNDDDDRLVISRFDQGSALSSAGLRRGDAIISIDGRRVTSQRDFERWVYEGRRPAVVVWRDGREKTIYLEDFHSQSATNRGPATLGVTLDTRYRNEVVIREVNPRGAADEAGLERGDAILSIDGEEIRNFSDLRGVLKRYSPGDEVEVQYLRDDREDTTVARLDGAGQQRTRYTDERTYATQPYDGVRRSSYREGERYIDNVPSWDRRGTMSRNQGRTFVDDDVWVDGDRRIGTRIRPDVDGYRDGDGRGVLGRRTRVDR
jgi:hypothetical protein